MLKYTVWSIKDIETRGVIERVGVLYKEADIAPSMHGDWISSDEGLTPVGEVFFERIGHTAFMSKAEAIIAGRLLLKRRLTALSQRRKIILDRLETL